MKFRLALVAAALAASGIAHAATYDYSVWTAAPANAPGATGVVATSYGNVGVTYVGTGFYQGDMPNWSAETSTWAGGAVSNVPTYGVDGILHLQGGTDASNTITFSQAITNPVMTIWSLGQNNDPTTFVFSGNAVPTVVAGGPSAEYGGIAITASGNTVTGIEGNGTVEFMGTFTSISWTNPLAENWYGFSVGAPDVAAAVPEPGSMGLLLAGLTLVGLAARRRQKR